MARLKSAGSRSYQSLLRSTHAGFVVSISASFFSRLHAFKLLFARDSRCHILMAFEPHKPITVVFVRKAFVFFPFVLEDSLEEVPSDANIQSPATAGDDVSKVASLMHTWQGIRSPRPGYVITKTTADPSTPVAGATCARDDIASSNRRIRRPLPEFSTILCRFAPWPTRPLAAHSYESI